MLLRGNGNGGCCVDSCEDSSGSLVLTQIEAVFSKASLTDSTKLAVFGGRIFSEGSWFITVLSWANGGDVSVSPAYPQGLRRIIFSVSLLSSSFVLN